MNNTKINQTTDDIVQKAYINVFIDMYKEKINLELAETAKKANMSAFAIMQNLEINEPARYREIQEAYFNKMPPIKQKFYRLSELSTHEMASATFMQYLKTLVYTTFVVMPYGAYYLCFGEEW